MEGCAMPATIELKLYASLAAYRSPEADRFPLPPAATAEALLAKLGIPPGEVKLIFVNGVRVDPDARLHPGDRVGLFPAVGGG
jgi:sulfur carrier protein ThiS